MPIARSPRFAPVLLLATACLVAAAAATLAQAALPLPAAALAQAPLPAAPASLGYSLPPGPGRHQAAAGGGLGAGAPPSPPETAPRRHRAPPAAGVPVEREPVVLHNNAVTRSFVAGVFLSLLLCCLLLN